MAEVYYYLSSNDYFESLAYKYKKFKKTPQWDEQYKWDTLQELNNIISFKDITYDNVIENIRTS